MRIEKIMMVVGLAAVSTLTLAVDAIEVTDVAARQRYPWNGLVDIDYTITGESAENMALAVTAKDVDTGRIYTPTNFLEASLPTSAGRHRVTWDTARDSLKLVATNMVFQVSLLKYDELPVRNDLYCVIDLSGGPDAERWPVSYLSAVPEGGWTDEYKTTKLVLRRIERGAISGLEKILTDSPDSIEILSPYYIGVFEVTSAQYTLITGAHSSVTYGDKRPEERVTYDDLRGRGIGSEYPETEIPEASVIGVLRKKTGMACELPTAKQWEYACRAGTTSWFNNGGSTEADLALVGRYKGNRYDGKGGFSEGTTTTVGSYLPNCWGLYDMHGNVSEWCRDRDGSGCYRIHRGGCWGDSERSCASGMPRRTASNQYSGDGILGFRLCIDIE